LPKHYATNLLKKLGIKSLPINSFEISESLRIPVVETSTRGYEGLLLQDDSNARIIIDSNIINIGRKHFTLAHELGHYSIPSHTKVNFKCISDFFNPFRRNPSDEIEANQFASELLLPEELIKPILHTYKPDFASINELAEDCGTSLTATAIKFASLSYDCCALIATSDNKIKWFQKSSSFPYEYYIEVGKSVSYGTLTASYSLEGILKETETQKVHASYWFNGRGIDNSTTMFESCVPMPYYGVVLTMLWFPETPLNSRDYSDDDDEEEYRYEADENTWRWRDPEQ
jgi:Zn-dependent peptidase ImmA (M78 family)